MSLTARALQHYRFVTVAVSALLLIGILSFLEMPRQEDPTMPTYVGIATAIYPGASVDEVEDRILEPLEEAINEMEEVERVESIALDGAGSVTGEFYEDIDTNEAYDLFVQRVAAVQRELPEGVTEVRLRAAKPSNVVVFQVAVHGPDAGADELRTWAEELEERLRGLPDAKSVEVDADLERELHVEVDPAALAAAGLSLTDVVRGIDAANAEIPGSLVHSDDDRLTVRAHDRFESLDDVAKTILTVIDGRPLLVEHVAAVTWGTEDARYVARHDGEPATLVSVTLKEGRNVFTLADDVKAVLADFEGDLPGELTATLVYDQSASVDRNLRTFFASLLQGRRVIVLLVAIVAGWRPAIVVISALLLSVGISFGILHTLGVALQQISIVGLVIVLGLLVDNAIVVVEGILSARHQGMSPLDAARVGTERVASAVASSTATTVAAFVPMMRMEGSVGAFTRDIPLTVSVVLVVSLLVAITVTPLTGRRLFASERAVRPSGLSPWVSRVLEQRLYPRTLRIALARPWMVIVLATVVVGGCLGLAPLVGMNFFPAAEKNVFLVQVELPIGTSLRTTEAAAADVEEWVGARPDVIGVTTNVGRGNPQIYYNQFRGKEETHVAELMVTVDPSLSKDTERITREIRDAFADHPDLVVRAKPFVQGPPIGQPVSVELTGSDLARLARHAAELEESLREIPGAINVSNDLRAGATRLDLQVDPVKTARLGLARADVAREVRIALAGMPATVIREGDDDVDVVVRVAAEGDESVADLGRILLPVPGSSPIPLAELTRPEISATYAAINHANLVRSVVVGADVDGRLATEVLADLMPSIDALPLGPDEHVRIIGEDEERDRAFLSMLINAVVAIGLIYGILVLQFRSFVQPLVVFSALPVALVGSILGLLLGGWPFGFTAFIGLLALTGIVVNDAIVLVDQVNRERREGRDLHDAVMTGSITRLQPVLLTTATTIAGLLPLTLSGHSMWTPPGWVIIGGMALATGVVLVLVPTLYFVVEGRAAARAAASIDRAPEPDATTTGPGRERLAVNGILLALGVGALALVAPGVRAQAAVSDPSAGEVPAPAPAEDAARPVTLEEILARIDAASPELAAERLRAEAVVKAGRTARAAWLPSISVSGEWVVTDDPSQAFGAALATGGDPFAIDPDATTDILRARVSADWVLWDFTRGPRIDAADREADVARHRAEALRAALEVAAVSAAYGVREAEELLAVRDAALDLVGRELADARARRDAGRGLDADVLGLEARHASLRAARIAARARLVEARADLARLLGMSPTTALTLVDGGSILPVPDVRSGSDLAARARTDAWRVRVIGSALDAGEAAARAASRVRLPRIVGNARYDVSVSERDLDDEGRIVSASVGVEWPLYVGGSIRSERERAVHLREAARAELEAEALRAEREAVTRWAERTAAVGRLDAAQLGRAAADEAYRIVSLRYAEGRDSLSRLLDAELSLTDARTEEVRATRAVAVAEARLREIAGVRIEVR